MMYNMSEIDSFDNGYLYPDQGEENAINFEDEFKENDISFNNSFDYDISKEENFKRYNISDNNFPNKDEDYNFCNAITKRDSSIIEKNISINKFEISKKGNEIPKEEKIKNEDLFSKINEPNLELEENYEETGLNPKKINFNVTKKKRKNDQIQKEPNRSLETPIKYFNTIFNIFLTGEFLLEPDLILKKFTGYKIPSKSLYLNKDFTQKKLSNEEHSKKFKQKILDYIHLDKSEKLKKKNERVKDLLESTFIEEFIHFYEWLYEHLEILKKDEKFIKMNEAFKSVTKYPLINLEFNEGNGEKIYGYLKYFGLI